MRRAHEEQDDVAGGGGGRKGDGNGGEMSGDYGEGRRWGPGTKLQRGTMLVGILRHCNGRASIRNCCPVAKLKDANNLDLVYHLLPPWKRRVSVLLRGVRGTVIDFFTFLSDSSKA